MHVILHTGVHCTDEDRILKCLLRNHQEFSDRGVAVPGPGKYRDLLGQTFRAMETSGIAPDARDVVMEAILDNETADRMILSNAFFFGSRRQAVSGGQFYPSAPARVAQMQRLFAGDRLDLFMGIRNPASFLPEVLGKAGPQQLAEALDGEDPRSLRWSDCLKEMRATAPDLPLTIWCNEDTPLIWAEIIRRMAGLEPGRKITGGFDLLGEIMTAEGMAGFRAYLQKHPKLTEPQKRAAMVSFLDRFAIPEKFEQELDLPGWTQDLVADLTEIYDADMQRIRDIPGVQVILP
ncbi:hypothetical protein QO034_11000 [Sedimentitalea sp. JM2-8]|uniref:Uncharacterized protein n=1 Tax=Sedimentitalea xiamensis TaxID=3050037 RepID=A0ABT7FF86_9RHOB|nr:hypothetical protein [Sedimentitalea xiamensis]MDK3073640.1 hypothetical protein [Sedimentitalea xiamensis]